MDKVRAPRHLFFSLESHMLSVDEGHAIDAREEISDLVDSICCVGIFPRAEHFAAAQGCGASLL